MTDDFFWGISLDKERKTVCWDPERDADPSDPSGGLRGEHTLLVKQIVLGPDVREGEVNVVEVEAMGYQQDMKFPIAVMKGGGPHQSVLDLLFPDYPVTFKLIKGNGPVYLLGNHSKGTGELGADDDDDDALDEELDDEDIDDLDEIAERNNIEERRRKLAQSNNSKPKAKKAKTDDEK